MGDTLKRNSAVVGERLQQGAHGQVGGVAGEVFLEEFRQLCDRQFGEALFQVVQR